MSSLNELDLERKTKTALRKAEYKTIESLVGVKRGDLLSIVEASTADDILTKLKEWQDKQETPTAEASAVEVSGLSVQIDTPAPAPEPAIASVEPEPAPEPAINENLVGELTALLKWAVVVFERQGKGSQGSHLASLLRQNVLNSRPDLTPNDFAEIEPARVR